MAVLKAALWVDKKAQLRAVYWDDQTVVHLVELSAVLKDA